MKGSGRETCAVHTSLIISYFHVLQLFFAPQLGAALKWFFHWVCHISFVPPSLILMWSPSNPGSWTIIIHQILISGPCSPLCALSPSSCLCFILSPNSSFFTFHFLFNLLWEIKRWLLRAALLSLSCKATNLADGGMWGWQFRCTAWRWCILPRQRDKHTAETISSQFS